MRTVLPPASPESISPESVCQKDKNILSPSPSAQWPIRLPSMGVGRRREGGKLAGCRVYSARDHLTACPLCRGPRGLPCPLCPGPSDCVSTLPWNAWFPCLLCRGPLGFRVHYAVDRLVAVSTMPWTAWLPCPLCRAVYPSSIIFLLYSPGWLGSCCVNHTGLPLPPATAS